MIKDYNSHKTAISRSKYSRPYEILKEKNLFTGLILDFGCGRGQDFQRLKNEGYNIEGYDKYNPTFEVLPTKKYDVITCNYVFNAIPTLKEHKETLELIKSLATNIYISVRIDIKAVKKDWVYNEENRGYWNSRTFQRFYTNDEIVKELFGNVEYVVNDSKDRIFKLK